MLLDVVANTPVGSTLQAKVLRDGRQQTVPITVGDRADVIGRESASNTGPQRGGRRGQPSTGSLLGIEVQAITSADLRRYGLSSENGVLITNVEPNGPAEEAGLDVGMVITGMVMNGRSTVIQGLEDFRNAEKGWKSGTDVSLRVLVRDDSGRYRSTLRTVTIP